MGQIIDNIRLRPSKEPDLDMILKLESDRENFEFIRQWSRKKHLDAMADENIAHMIIETAGNKRPVGYIILLGLKDPDENIEFKRMVIAEKGMGYGRQAVRLVKQFAFEKRHCHRLWLEVMDHNIRAYALYDSEGFVLEGIHRESVKKPGKRITVQVMSMLAHEYVKEAGDSGHSASER
jgi:diamine N-acetyltransferase